MKISFIFALVGFSAIVARAATPDQTAALQATIADQIPTIGSDPVTVTLPAGTDYVRGQLVWQPNAGFLASLGSRELTINGAVDSNGKPTTRIVPGIGFSFSEWTALSSANNPDGRITGNGVYVIDLKQNYSSLPEDNVASHLGLFKKHGDFYEVKTDFTDVGDEDFVKRYQKLVASVDGKPLRYASDADAVDANGNPTQWTWHYTAPQTTGTRDRYTSAMAIVKTGDPESWFRSTSATSLSDWGNNTHSANLRVTGFMRNDFSEVEVGAQSATRSGNDWTIVFRDQATNTPLDIFAAYNTPSNA